MEIRVSSISADPLFELGSRALFVCSYNSSSPFSITSAPAVGRFKLLRIANRFGKNGRSIRVGLSASVRVPDNDVEDGCGVRDDATDSSKRFSTIDKNMKLCNLRCGRELALTLMYASCLEGSDPVRLFERRLSMREESMCRLDTACLMQYDHSSFSSPPMGADTVDQADDLLNTSARETEIEMNILSAPLRAVYAGHVIAFARGLLVAVMGRWDKSVEFMGENAPLDWKGYASTCILELCILHVAMAEMSELGTPPPLAKKEAICLAKRYCNGRAPSLVKQFLDDFAMEIHVNRSEPLAGPAH